MANFDSFRDIEAWQVARTLTQEIYKITESGEFSSDYGLKNQMQRSSVSIMSNIAEGFERDGNKEFIQFISTAKGSNGELLSQLIVAKDIGYISEEQFSNLSAFTEEISNKLGGLINYLKSSNFDGNKYK